MNFEELVPPLEFCKLIPQGKFGDSACVYVFDPYCEEWDFTIREDEDSLAEVIPAPTATEILLALWRNYQRPTVFYRHYWYASVINDFGDEIAKLDNENPANAALKLWLNLEGIEYAE